jgi:endonuclease YncB( thermonuclease family)
MDTELHEKSRPNILTTKLKRIGLILSFIFIFLLTAAVSMSVGYYSRDVQDFKIYKAAEHSLIRTKFDQVLDGDTVVVDGIAIKIRGIDAPELGPAAKCWAEALAARGSMLALEEELFQKHYRAIELRKDGLGKASANFTDAEGYSLSDFMTVHGGAALTDGKWNWCGIPPSDGREETLPPHGPNTWWPSGKVLDKRAFD